MPFSPPPAPPPDAVEVTEYKIKDQIYFFHDSKRYLTPQCHFANIGRIAGEWRKGEVKDYEGSSDESPRYLVSTYWTGRATGSPLMQKRNDRSCMRLLGSYTRWRLVI